MQQIWGWTQDHEQRFWNTLYNTITTVSETKKVNLYKIVYDFVHKGKILVRVIKNVKQKNVNG